MTKSWQVSNTLRVNNIWLNGAISENHAETYFIGFRPLTFFAITVVLDVWRLLSTPLSRRNSPKSLAVSNNSFSSLKVYQPKTFWKLIKYYCINLRENMVLEHSRWTRIYNLFNHNKLVPNVAVWILIIRNLVTIS